MTTSWVSINGTLSSMAALDRYSDGARDVIGFARDEAAGLRYDYVGTEHVLLGLLRQCVADVLSCLDALGVTFVGVRWEVAARAPDAELDEPPPFAPDALRVIELARVAADRRGHALVLPADLLLAAAFDQGQAREIMVRRGADADAVRDLLDRFGRS
jgi:ATP-dependent Clp protease ATP-binding subunit ClpC